MAHEEKPTPEAQPADHAHGESGHEHSDTVVILGQSITVAGGIYTVVFGALAILTIVEVLLGSIQNDIRVIPLAIIALAKAALVVIFYMHLRTDSRIFAFTLLIPLGVALISIIYLLAVPPVGY